MAESGPDPARSAIRFILRPGHFRRLCRASPSVGHSTAPISFRDGTRKVWLKYTEPGFTKFRNEQGNRISHRGQALRLRQTQRKPGVISIILDISFNYWHYET